MTTPDARSGPPFHNPNEVMLGAVGSSDHVIDNFDADPASFPAGYAVSNNDGTLERGNANAALHGVSAGKSLSDIERTAIIRSGNWVPLVIAAYLATEEMTLLKKVNAPVSVVFQDTVSAGNEVSAVTGDAESGYVVTVSIEGGVSTATQVKAAIDGDAESLALIEAVITGTAGNDEIAFTSTPVDVVDHAVEGQVVYIHDTLGIAVPAAAGVATSGIYSSGVKTGVYQDASEMSVVEVDMGGGL